MKLYLTESIAKEIKKKLNYETIMFSPDLGISEISMQKKELEKINFEKIRGDFIYLWNGKTLVKLAIFDEHFFRLRMLGKIPILEIDGFRMHLTNDFESPFQYAEQIANFLNSGKTKKPEILDCFAGLGYVSITISKKFPNSGILALEKNKPVLELAKENPYSREFFSSKNIKIKNQSVLDYLQKNTTSFDFIIADPPSYRMKESKDFYTEKFILALFSRLNFNGVMYFYSGRIAKGKIEKILVKNKIAYSYNEKMLGFFIKKAF